MNQHSFFLLSSLRFFPPSLRLPTVVGNEIGIKQTIKIILLRNTPHLIPIRLMLLCGIQLWNPLAALSPYNHRFHTIILTISDCPELAPLPPLPAPFPRCLLFVLCALPLLEFMSARPRPTLFLLSARTIVFGWFLCRALAD